jgi:hypothetical protein
MSVQVPARSGSPATLIISLIALVVAIGGVVTAVLVLRQPSRSSTQRYLLLEKGSEKQPASAGQAMASGLPQPAQAPGAEVPAAPPSSATPGSAPDPTALTRTFTQQMAPIQDCMTKHRADLGGTQQLSIFFSIDASGKVGEATLAPGRLTPTPLGKCVLDAAHSIKFGPQPSPAAFRIPLTTGLN